MPSGPRPSLVAADGTDHGRAALARYRGQRTTSRVPRACGRSIPRASHHGGAPARRTPCSPSTRRPRGPQSTARSALAFAAARTGGSMVAPTSRRWSKPCKRLPAATSHGTCGRREHPGGCSRSSVRRRGMGHAPTVEGCGDRRLSHLPARCPADVAEHAGELRARPCAAGRIRGGADSDRWTRSTAATSKRSSVR